ncbi:MAG: c-type cytochrome [Acidiferrobacterales bacterium]
MGTRTTPLASTFLLIAVSLILAFRFMSITGLAKASSALASGKQLFSDNCAVCHGNGGKGGVGVPLALPDFINNVDDDYLRISIKKGRPGRVMPSFPSMDETQISAIVRYMRFWTGKSAPHFNRGTISADAAKGKQLYQQRCATCHGANGEGGKGTGVTFSRPRDLPILAPALNNPGFLAAASDEMIRHTLIKGRAGTPMISFLKQGLSHNDINNVVTYVRSFDKQNKNTTHDKFASEPPFLVRESRYSVEQTVKNLNDAILSANMRLIRTQYLEQGLTPPGEENKKQVIVYSCGFNFLNEALKVDPRVGLFLPCRVTVVEHKGKVLVMSVNPKRLSVVFNNTELERLCDQMHSTYLDILEEATL